VCSLSLPFVGPELSHFSVQTKISKFLISTQISKFLIFYKLFSMQGINQPDKPAS
jgi:hypothetical protein